jgi:hypothetical protein
MRRKKNTKRAIRPNGYFINQTFLHQIAEKSPSEIPMYCTELTFDASDSALMSNGIENAYLRFEKIGNDYQFIHAFRDGQAMRNLKFIFENDSIFYLEDSSYTKQNQASKFVRINAATSFEKIVNESTVSGKYNLYKLDKNLNTEVVLHSDGRVENFENFTQYEICYAGDCVQETSVPARIIYFYNNSKAMTCMVWNWKDHKKKQLELYGIEAPTPEIKGGRRILEKIYELEKIRN